MKHYSKVKIRALLQDDSHLTCSKKGLIKKIQKIFDRVKMYKITTFINDVFNSYFDNPFHNIRHAYEVLEMTAIITSLCKLDKYYDSVELKILFLAALCHDTSHEGFTNIELSSSTSMTTGSSYDNLLDVTSYNERIHIEKTLQLIAQHKSLLFKGKNVSDDLIQDYITSIIMSTDLKLHNIYLGKLIEQPLSSPINLNFVLKLADLSHFFRTFKVHCFWVYRLQQERNTLLLEAKDLSKDTLSFQRTFIVEMYELLRSIHSPIGLLDMEYKKNIKIWGNFINY